ncbi:MAG TPA: PstA family ABC transporter permease [Miltoncostaeaceae bacterium]|nr:PstA family ABC transporter permease [Miltoncostaeaceae bacterium]
MTTGSAELPVAATAHRPLAKKRGRPGDAVFHGLLLTALGIALAALAWLFISILSNGLGNLSWDFITSRPSSNPARAGFISALKGTLVLMFYTVLVAIPVGFAAALYLEKFASRTRDDLEAKLRRRERRIAERRAAGAGGPGMAFAQVRLAWSRVWVRVGPPVNHVLDVNISNLAAVPSIIYGLLGLALFVAIMGFSKSLLAGGLTLGVLVLPIIIISAREAVRAVPVSIEQGAMALGATRLQAVMRQVFPAALPGMLTGSILALSRAIGETAPLIVVGGVTYATREPSLNPLEADAQPLFAMPLQIYSWADRPQQAFLDLAATGIIVLIASLIVMNLLAIWLRNRYTRRW